MDNNKEISNDVYSPEMLKELDKHSKAVHSGLGKINVDIEKVAFNLYWIYENKAYKVMGHDTIMDYSRDEFDFSKSTTYNFINIVERFGKRDKDGKLLTFGCFDKKYSVYSYSKLVLLADLDDSDIEILGIKPDMSVRDIKKAIKGGIEIGTIEDPSLTPVSDPISELSLLLKSQKQGNVVKDEPEPDSQQLIEFKDNEAVSPDVPELNKSSSTDVHEPYPIVKLDGKRYMSIDLLTLDYSMISYSGIYTSGFIDTCKDMLKSYPGSHIEVRCVYPAD